MGWEAGAQHIFNISTSEQMRLTSTGLGIGTTSPTVKLDVVGAIKATTAGVAVIAVEGAAQLYAAVQMQATSSGGKNWSLVSNATGSPLGAAGSLSFRDSSAGTTHMTLDTSGNLGIGTTSPGTQLQVNSTGNTAVTISAGNTGLSRLIFQGQVANNRGFIDYDNTSSVRAMIFRTNEAEWMRLTDAGTLNIVGAGTAGSTQAISFNGSTPVDTLVTTSGGNVGIGTSSPLAKLHVAGEARFVSGAATQPAITITQGFINADISSANFTIGNFGDNSSEMRVATRGFTTFFTGATNNSTGTERMRLDSSGNLGLGVTPSAWVSPGKFIQFGNGNASIGTQYNGDANFIHNAYESSAGTFTYILNGFALRYQLDINNNAHKWYVAPSGTANTTTVTSGKSYTIVTAGGTNYTSFGAANNNVGTAFTATSSGTGNGGAVSENISFTQAMTLDASGRLLIGTTSSTVYYNSTQTYTASAVLKTNVSNEITDLVLINGNNDFGSTLDFARTNTSSNDVRFGLIGGVPTSNTAGSEAGYVYFATKGTADTNVVERARITSNGEFLVGTQNAIVWNTTNEGVVLSGVAIQASRDDDVPMLLNRIGSNGSILVFARQGLQVGDVSVTTTATAYNTSSDYRLKDNPQPLTNSGAFIDALKPKTWDWKADGSKGVGFLAHEVQEVSPGSVNGEKDAVDADGKPVMQAMEYGSAEFIANIVAELQSLRARVAQLESKGA
jgi:hypothetical protein